MATNFSETKSIRLAQIVGDLNSGLTKWKKDDIGFGSIEKKYNLFFLMRLLNYSTTQRSKTWNTKSQHL